MGILHGKTILVSGVFNESSIGFRVADLAQDEGADVILSSFGRHKNVTKVVARRLRKPAPVVDFDAENEDHIVTLGGQLADHTEGLDGIFHGISSSLPSVVGDHFPTANWDDVGHSFRVSAYSYQSLVHAADAFLRDNASVVGCTLDASVAWPVYGWAGVAKAAYESVNRYLAYHLGPRGIRANLIASGPISSFAKGEIADIDSVDGMWERRAPLAWNARDSTPVAKTAAVLLSDYTSATTGEVIHVDGGFHAIGY